MKRQPLAYFGTQPVYSPLVAKHVSSIVSAKHRPSGGIDWRFACAAEGCRNAYNLQALRQGQKECEPCRRKRRTLFGVSYVSPLVQAHKARIKNIERVGQGNIYTIECATDGCEHVYRVNKLNKIASKKCIWCWRKGRRRNPKWTPHYRKLVKVSRDIGKQCTITFSQFRRLCEIPVCFYCGDKLDRQPYVTPGKKKNLAYRLDRMFPSGNYSLDNVVSCCWRCNNMKRDSFTAREIALIWRMRAGLYDAATRIMHATDAQFAAAARRWCVAHEREPAEG